MSVLSSSLQAFTAATQVSRVFVLLLVLLSYNVCSSLANVENNNRYLQETAGNVTNTTTPAEDKEKEPEKLVRSGTPIIIAMSVVLVVVYGTLIIASKYVPVGHGHGHGDSHTHTYTQTQPQATTATKNKGRDEC